MEALKTYSLNNSEQHSDSSDFEDPSTDTCNRYPVNYYMMPKFKKKNTQRDKKKNEGSNGTTLNVVKNKCEVGDAPDIVCNTRTDSNKYNLRDNTVLQQSVREASDRHYTVSTKKDTFQTRSELLKPRCHDFQIEKGIVKSFSKASHEVYYVKNETSKIIKNKKFEKLYAIEPVLTIDGNIYGLPVKSLKRNSIEDCLSSCSLTSSIESATQKSKPKGKHENSHSKNKKERRKILKESKRKNNPYYIYTSSSQFKTQETAVANCETCDASSSMRSNENPPLNFSPSKIWNFLINRGFSIPEDNKCCRCSAESENCKSLKCPHSVPNKQSNCSLNNRQTAPLFLQPAYPSTFPQPSQPTLPGSGIFKCPCGGGTSKTPPQGFSSQLKRTDPTSCDCPGNKNKTNISHGPHNQIVQRLEEQYKSQVLCIHNPPCVLINGCLNITKPSDASLKSVLKPAQSPAACPPKKMSHGIIRKKKVVVAQKCDKSCQFHRPYVEMFPCEFENKSDIREQMTQSLCYHDPPCNLVPGCRKHAGFFADTHCHHVPICQDYPECSVYITEQETEAMNKSDAVNKATNHTKNCEAFYMCNDNTGFCNMESKKSGCSHSPRCILIPKCLCFLIGQGYLSREVMPDCLHNPRCELVPACYFKTLEMTEKPEVGLPTKTARVPIYYQHKIFSRFKFRKV